MCICLWCELFVNVEMRKLRRKIDSNNGKKVHEFRSPAMLEDFASIAQWF